MNERWPYRTGGVPDELFVRGSVPMTKEEVRAVVISKLRLAEGQVIWDVGAGTGSVSVEIALAAPAGRIYAVERNPEGLELIRANRDKFKTENVYPVSGEAPEALLGLPSPDRIFVGGSGPTLEKILRQAALVLRPGGRLVLSAVTLETQSEGFTLLGELFGPVEAVQLGVSVGRKVGAKHLWQARNPVCLMVVERGQ